MFPLGMEVLFDVLGPVLRVELELVVHREGLLVVDELVPGALDDKHVEMVIVMTVGFKVVHVVVVLDVVEIELFLVVGLLVERVGQWVWMHVLDQIFVLSFSVQPRPLKRQVVI